MLNTYAKGMHSPLNITLWTLKQWSYLRTRYLLIKASSVYKVMIKTLDLERSELPEGYMVYAKTKQRVYIR